MKKYYGPGLFKTIEPDFKLGWKLRDVREAIISVYSQSSTLTGQYGLHVVIDTVQLWHGPLVVDCLLSDATISLLSSVVTIVSLDTGPHPPLYLLLSNILHCICPACWDCVLHIDTEICEVDRLDIDSSVSPVLGPHPLGVSTYPPHFVGFTSFQLRIQNANELMTFITTDWFAYNWNGNWKPHDCFHFFFNFQENKCWGRLTADWLLAPGRGTFHTQLCRSAPTWARVHVNNNNIHPLTPQGLCFYKQLEGEHRIESMGHQKLSSTRNVPESKWSKTKG